MRKYFGALAFVLILFFGLSCGVFAGPNVTVTFDPTVTLEYNGHPWLARAASGKVIYPFMYTVGGTSNTYLPVRAIAELAGLEVGYVQPNRTIVLKLAANVQKPAKGTDQTPYFPRETATGEIADDMKILLNGKRYLPTNPQGVRVDPILINGATYLPLRAIGELVGLEVKWNGERRSISLTNPRDVAAYPAAGERPAVVTAAAWYNLAAIGGQAAVYEGYNIQIPRLYSNLPGAVYLNESLIGQDYAQAIATAAQKPGRSKNYGLQIFYETGGADTLDVIVRRHEGTWGENWREGVRIYHYDYVGDTAISPSQLLTKHGLSGSQVKDALIAAVGIYGQGGKGRGESPPVRREWLDAIGNDANHLNITFGDNGLTLYYVGQDVSGEILAKITLQP